MDKQKEKEAQKRYMELQLLEQQMKQLQKNAKLLDGQLEELYSVLQNIDDFRNVAKKTPLWIPLSSGIFAKAELSENTELMVNVGADIAVKKSIPDAKSLVQSQMDDLRKVHNQVMEELQRIAVRAMGLEKELNRLLSE